MAGGRGEDSDRFTIHLGVSRGEVETEDKDLLKLEPEGPEAMEPSFLRHTVITSVEEEQDPVGT